METPESETNTRPSHTIDSKVSLYELISWELEYRSSQSGRPPPSEIIFFLAEQMETEEFWLQLNLHLVEDTSERQSVGGVFFRSYGERNYGVYTWHQLFKSLDNFTRLYQMRATEFIFGYFYPSRTDNPRVINFMIATRVLAFDKYPRLRRMQWDHYQDAFRTSTFWESLSRYLDRLSEPVSVSYFFYEQGIRLSDAFQRAQGKIILDAGFWITSLGYNNEALFIGFSGLGQIIRDSTGIDPRSFLLQYNPAGAESSLLDTIAATQYKLEQKIMPPVPRQESLRIIDRQELAAILSSRKYWEQLSEDITDFMETSNTTVSFAVFLRYFDDESKLVLDGRTGGYAFLATPFARTIHSQRKDLIEPARKLVTYMMWEFKPPEDLVDLVNEVRGLCGDFFPRDCLYAQLQSPVFWERFQEELSFVQGPISFFSFLRYYSQQNPRCHARSYTPGSAIFRQFLHRAYHKQVDFLTFLKQIGIRNVADYKIGLVRLFRKLSPNFLIDTLAATFPKEFTYRGREEIAGNRALLKQARELLKDLARTPEKAITLNFPSPEKAIRFRVRVRSAGTAINIYPFTTLQGSNLTISLTGTRRRTPAEQEVLEYSVMELRTSGMKNAQIAQRLGVEDYTIEYIVGKLIAQGLIDARA